MSRILKLAIIIPCYNEENVLNNTIPELISYLNQIKANLNFDYSIFLIDDGSTDNTFNIIKQLKLKYNSIHGIKLLYNVGQQLSFIIGLKEAHNNNFDSYLTLDADLQDDYTLIKEMINNYIEGYDITFGVRNNRDSDTFFKKFTAELYYKILKLFNKKIIINHADFRMISRRVVKFILNNQYTFPFLRGVLPLLDFKYKILYYRRRKQNYRKSRWPILRMLKFAIDGIITINYNRLINLHLKLIIFNFFTNIILLTLKLYHIFTINCLLYFYIIAHTLVIFNKKNRYYIIEKI